MNKDIYIVEYYKSTAEYYLNRFCDQFGEFVKRKYKYRLELENGVTITAVGFGGDISSEHLYFLTKRNPRKFRGMDLIEKAYQDYIKDLKEQLEAALNDEYYDE